ncbi:MAG: right-handed parallel beta-helix repeat-containing protein, partial [Candidatus Kariarchaeaceae archaeon]
MKVKLIQLILIMLLGSGLIVPVQPDQNDTNSIVAIEQTGTCPYDPLACVPHNPIYIDGNENLADQAKLKNWDLDGTRDGSKGLPYMISGYMFNGTPGGPPLIEVRNVDLWLQIRYNYLDGMNASFKGIYFVNVNNSRVLDNYITNMIDDGSYSSHGIMLQNSYYNRLIRNEIWGDPTDYGKRMGIAILDSSYNKIILNTMYFLNNGLEIYRSVRIHVDRNTIFNCGTGLYSYDNSHIPIYDNNITACYNGIYVHKGNYNRISNNLLDYNNYGFNFYDTNGYNGLTNNTISYSQSTGIYLNNANSTSIRSNSIMYTQYGFGISVQSGLYNYIAWNNFISNNWYSSQANDNGTSTTFLNNHYSEHTGYDYDFDNFENEIYLVAGNSLNSDPQPLSMTNYVNDFGVLTPTYNQVVDDQLLITWSPAFDTYNHHFNYSVFISSDGGYLWTQIESAVDGTSYVLDTTTYESGDTYAVMVIARG